MEKDIGYPYFVAIVMVVVSVVAFVPSVVSHSPDDGK